ncbi:hypothetical protein A3C98_00930 [Candidatus Roizmanbacteria bacterium RIFCSPHIGHO2_02_FULL_37_15]|nr:MAG: hypothetical protein A2859_04110 [Candidatus Roizmanbacteria bacterium RIFCSPHIGHO2_01_FULL_37_16b]OGK22746.1 MAG: hypothetical protein A3C98_00930 [Candidatus Roizmanbacteria bacterium RIFCSPHIGHO2_02_FULL_37_15]
MSKAKLLALLLLGFLLASLYLPKVASSFSPGEIFTSSQELLPDQYIVVYKDNVSNPDTVTDDLEKLHLLRSRSRFSKVIKGFSSFLSQEKLERLKKDPRVAFITQDREVSIVFHSSRRRTKTPTPTRTSTPTRTPTPQKSSTPFPSKTPTPTPTTSLTSQTIPLGISRIGLNGVNEGSGIGVAIIDTGIDLDHPDLAQNIIANKSCISGEPNGDDDHGHGTHVAGTVAALNNSTGVIGVAPQAKLIAVKVLNSQGSGSYSSLICGIDWITANVANYNIKVANMSLGGGGASDGNCGNSNSDALHLAICRSRDAGITYVVAAGNSGANAASTVPAAYDDAVITVSALADSDGQPGGLGPNTSYGSDDTFASFSNYGGVVDLGGPGVNILSTYRGGGYGNMSGTSMSSPHVAGAASLYLKTNPQATWSQVRDGLMGAGESLNSGHTDPSGLHPEKVVKTNSL